MCLNVLHRRPGSRGMRSSRRPPAPAPHHNSAASLNIKQTQCKQCKQLGRSLYFSLLQRETRKPLRSPPLPPSDESSTVVQAWQSGRRRPPSPAPPPPSADLHQLLQLQHQKHQASPVFASKALPTRRQRGEKHQKHHKLTSSFTKFDSFFGMFAPLIFLKQFIAVDDFSS